MAFLSLLAALALEQLRPSASWAQPLLSGFRRYAATVAASVNAGGRAQGAMGWALAVLPWVLLCLLVHVVLALLSTPADFLWNTLVLFLCMRFAPTGKVLMGVFDALERGDAAAARALLEDLRGESLALDDERQLPALAVETGIGLLCRDLFGVALWFLILPGPCGAVLYRLALELRQLWGREGDEEFREFGRFPRKVQRLLDWLPHRVAAVGFAVAGDFEGAAYCWRTQAGEWPDADQGVALAAGAGALAVRIGGPRRQGDAVQYRPELGVGDWAEAASVHSAYLLLWRTLVAWLAVLLLITLAAWSGV